MKKLRGFEPVAGKYLRSYFNRESVIMPLRGTKSSAGYDFFLPEDIEIAPGESCLIWSDVKAYMQGGEVLELYPRSSIAIKMDIQIKNTVGIIDADYYSNEGNDGNIGICLFNTGKELRTFEKGTAIAQCIFKLFLESDNCNSDLDRVGGIGSTNEENK